MELSEADQVWNRACAVESILAGVDEPGGAGVGDRHLWAIIRVWGALCSGGVGFVFDALSVEDCALAQEGCDYFGLDEFKALIDGIARTPQDEVEELYEAAWFAWDDRELRESFKRRFAEAPEDFSPLDAG